MAVTLRFMNRFKSWKSKIGGFRKKFSSARFQRRNTRRFNKRFRRPLPNYRFNGGVLGTAEKFVRRPLGRSSGRSFGGVSVAGWLLIGAVAYFFINPVKNFVNGLLHKK